MPEEGIFVGVRLRPPVAHERGQKPCFVIKDDNVLKVQTENVETRTAFEGTYTFDAALDSSIGIVGNEKCYEVMGRRMVKHLFEGFNTCLFAYGQTGSGKTTTIMGDKDTGLGLLPRVVDDVFKEAESLRKKRVPGRAADADDGGLQRDN